MGCNQEWIVWNPLVKFYEIWDKIVSVMALFFQEISESHWIKITTTPESDTVGIFINVLNSRKEKNVYT